MPVFVVRGVDGQLGIVAARNTVRAVERLDEFANFEGCPVRELPELMLLLDIGESGELTLAGLGEETEAAIRTFGYPLLEKALARGTTPASESRVRRAVEAERERVRPKARGSAITERGREISQQLDLPSSLVRQHERLVARRILKRTKVPKDAKKQH